ncbi:serine/arginine repetitive matrix protein 2-like isoform X2 [Amphibalanus amphitrite]|uniref:serine/arginine repetitive matrix protein 2-like isoform X2 n=1 Tax=Amphibalanus amphitrite TaxID=1232801 RepID=UPI001C91AA2E|nr:serine/arginine repetitive matrix protein 2-like isoform X2 [Amphibalanus amphitrite]
MRDLVQFVRQLWEDRLQSVEEFTKENNLSLEEALQMRNKELEGCMKDLESQTDALLDALEEADSLLASPRRDDEKLHRKLALGECLQRIGKQEEEAERAYDQEKVAFLRQARQLLIDSFQGDSPVLSASSLVDDVKEAGDEAEDTAAVQEKEALQLSEPIRILTEEHDMQTDTTPCEETATQTRALIAKKIKALKKQTDQLAPKILRREKGDSKSPKRSPRRSSPESAKKKLKAKKVEAITPQYINARLKIRAPSPRRHRLPWESATEEDGDDGYTSTDLSPALPPQPNNSAVSLAEPSDDNMGFETAEETVNEQGIREKKEKEKARKVSKSPKRTKATKKAKSPKRAEDAAEGGQQQPVAPAAPAGLVPDIGQGEGGRPRRRRSKTQRSQMKSSGAAAAESSDEEGERRRRAAEPHGDGGRPTLSRRRSPRTTGDGSAAVPERRATAPARGARAKHALSPPPASHVYCLPVVPQPADLNAVAAAAAAAAAAAQSDSKLMQVDLELGAKQRAVQPRPTRRKRCSGGGDTMSVQSFNSAEDGRGRGGQELASPRPVRPAVQPPAEPDLHGATGGGLAAAAPGFHWESGHTLYQPEAASGASGAAPRDDPWLYRLQQQRDLTLDLPPADGSPDGDKQQPAGGEDSGFQSEAPPRSPAGTIYVPPLPLPLLTTSDASEAASPQPRPKSDTEIASLGTPRSPSRGGARVTSPVRQVERSFSCEVPTKKQRCAEEPAAQPVSPGSGDQPAVALGPRRSSLKSRDTAPADTAQNQETPSPPASPSTGYTPQPSPAEHTGSDGSEYRDCVAPAPAELPAAAPTEPSPAPADTAATPACSTGPVSPTSPAAEPPQPAAPATAPAPAPAVAAAPSTSNTTLLRRDYEQLRIALAELKELQTSFQKDFAANEHAKEASSRLQSDIQRMETSIQDLQGIVSQEYEQTRQDHEETRAAIEQIETRVQESERVTQSQLNELRARLEQITDKMTRLEGDVSREKALTEEKEASAAAPNVLTLSSMLTRLETEVITLRHEVDSNRHSIDSITSVTQLDSPKPSPGSGLHDQSNTSDWQETGRTDATQDSAPAGAGDASELRQEQKQQTTASGAATAAQPARQQTETRPEDLDSFKDSNSDMMSTAEEGNDEPERTQQSRRQQQPPPPQQQTGQQAGQQAAAQPSRQQRQRASQTEMPEQRRPAIVSPLKMVGGRRSISCCRRHQPEVLRQLRQMHLAPPPPPPAAPASGKRSRSAAPPGVREESEYDSPLQDYWAADLSTASASTEAPRVNESTRVHHGSSRQPSAQSEERHRKADAFLARLDNGGGTSDKLDQLQHKLLSLRRRVLLSMYRRQRRRAVSEGPRGRQADQQQQRRRAQLAAIDRRLRQRIHGWNRRLLAEAGYQGSSTLSPGDVISDSSVNSREFRRSSEPASDSGSPPPAPAPGSASQRAASEYLHQLSHMLATSAERDGAKARAASRGRHRERTLSPPTKDPSAAEFRPGRRRRPAAVNEPGEHMERFARNESKLVELQEYLGGIRQHLQRMASELDSPPSALSAAAARGARGVPVTQAVVFRPWTRRHRSVSSHRPMVSLRY